MNLADKKEMLKSKKLEIKGKIKKLDEVESKTKEITIDDNKFQELLNNISSLEEEITNLKNDIESLSGEITEEEKNLEFLAKEAKISKSQKSSGGNKMEYLKTKEALADFAKLLRKTGGRDALKEAWSQHLKVKGITNPDVLLPQAVVTSISDAFQKSGSIFATFKYTGLTMLKIAINTNTDPVTSRARGHKKGVTKGEQVITLATKEIRAQYIYKYITLDRETLRENQDTGAIIKYVLEELPQRIIMEIERAALIGDGRNVADDDKISSYEAIARTSSDDFVSVQNATTNLLEDLVKMDATIIANGPRYLVVSRQTLADLKLTSNQGGLVFPIGSDIASSLGYTAIFTPDFMTNSNAPKAIEYVGEAYKVVGDNTMESFENFVLAQNKNEYLMEIYSGGGLYVLKSAAVLISTP